MKMMMMMTMGILFGMSIASAWILESGVEIESGGDGYYVNQNDTVLTEMVYEDGNAYFYNSTYDNLIWRFDNDTIIDQSDNTTLPDTDLVENVSIVIDYRFNLTEGEKTDLFDVNDAVIDTIVPIMVKNITDDIYVFLNSTVDYEDINITVKVTSLDDLSAQAWKYKEGSGEEVNIEAENVTYASGMIYALASTNVDTGDENVIYYTLVVDATFSIAMPSDYASWTEIIGEDEGGATSLDWISFNFTDYPEYYCEPQQLGSDSDKQEGVEKPIFYIDVNGNTDMDIKIRFSSSLPGGIVVGGNASCSGTYVSCQNVIQGISTDYVTLIDDLSQTDSFGNVTLYANVTGGSDGESAGQTLYIYGVD